MGHKLVPNLSLLFSRWRYHEVMGTTSCPKDMGLGIFGPKNGAMPKLHHAYGVFCSCWGPNRILKIGPNSPSRSLERMQRNLGPKISTAQKRELRPKQKLMFACQYCLGEIYPVGLAKHPLEKTCIFPYCVSNILNDSAQRLMNTKSSREIASHAGTARMHHRALRTVRGQKSYFSSLSIVYFITVLSL